MRLLTNKTHVRMSKLTLLARIIDQSVKGIETTQDVILGEGYNTVMRSNLHSTGSNFPECPEWQEALDAYWLEKPVNNRHDEVIIGFIYGDNMTVAIKDNQVAYIVTDKGDTVKRVYGLLKRY